MRMEKKRRRGGGDDSGGISAGGARTVVGGGLEDVSCVALLGYILVYRHIRHILVTKKIYFLNVITF